MTENHFDFLVIGGGSGGIASARRAAAHGARTILFEDGAIGGTCVNVGCVPKKVMWNTSHIAGMLRLAPEYGFSFADPEFRWPEIKGARDAFVERLNGIYRRNLEKSGVTEVRARARFVDDRTIEADGTRYTADHILVATGGRPTIPELPGAGLGIDSDGFFELEELPQTVTLIGSGYVATEFAGMLAGLGAKVTQVLRKDRLLRSFDRDLSGLVMEQMRDAGIRLITGATPLGLERNPRGGIDVLLDSGTVENQQVALWAVGRHANLDGLDPRAAGLHCIEKGYIPTDDWQNTNVKGIYAVGDVTGRLALTPVAIAAGRRLADRLFGGQPDARLDYENVATAIFSHPPIGTVGLTEDEAVARFDRQNIKVYKNRFTNILYGPGRHKPPTLVKLVTAGPTEKVVGCHIAGDSADEIIQGFAVAVKMGATKADLDNTVAIHPTAAEELVTLR